MWFLTSSAVVCTPMILVGLPQRKNCGSFFKKHNFDKLVQLFDIHCRFFSCLHLAVGRHHRRRTSWCPHGRTVLDCSDTCFREEDFFDTSWSLRKRVFWGVVFTPTVGCNRPPSASNDSNCNKIENTTGFTVLSWIFACVLIYRLSLNYYEDHHKSSLISVEWILVWRSWLASRLQSCHWCLTLTRYMRWYAFRYVRNLRILSSWTRWWKRRQWIYRNVSRYTMRIPNVWRLIVAAQHSPRTP